MVKMMLDMVGLELGNFVYDSTVMLKFDKNIYYALYKCSNVEKINKEDYLKASRDFVKQSVSYDIKDFLPNWRKRECNLQVL